MGKVLEQLLFGLGREEQDQTEFVAVADSSGQDDGGQDDGLDGMVGEMFWFTIPAALRVDRDVLQTVYAKAGIDRRFLPPVVREADAFRRLTQELATAGEFKDIDGKLRRVSLMIREVASDRTRVVRHMIAEVRDEKHVRLLYEPCMQFELQKLLSRVSVTHLGGMAEIPPDAQQVVQGAADKFREAWQTATRVLDDGHVRRAVDGLMRDQKVVDLRPNGGLYFALRAHARVVRQIEGLFDGLQEAGVPDAAFCSAPLVDRAKQRGAVAEAALRQVTAEAESLQQTILGVCEAAKNGRQVRMDTAQDYLREVKRLRDLAEEYRLATRDAMAGAEAALEVVMAQVTALMAMAD